MAMTIQMLSFQNWSSHLQLESLLLLGHLGFFVSVHTDAQLIVSFAAGSVAIFQAPQEFDTPVGWGTSSLWSECSGLP